MFRLLKARISGRMAWCLVIGLTLTGAVYIGIQYNRRYGKEPERRTHRWAGFLMDAAIAFSDDQKRLPMPNSVVSATDADTDTSAAAGFVTMLAGGRNEQNPTERIYFSAALVDLAETDAETRTRGLVKTSKGFVFYDWWGRTYRVRLDGDADGYVDDPERAGHRLHQPLIIWSSGRDGDFNTWSDNVATWFRYQDSDFSRAQDNSH